MEVTISSNAVSIVDRGELVAVYHSRLDGRTYWQVWRVAETEALSLYAGTTWDGFRWAVDAAYGVQLDEIDPPVAGSLPTYYDSAE